LTVRRLVPVSLVALGACAPTLGIVDEGTDASELAVALQLVAIGLEAPVYATSPPFDRRLFIVEQPGRVRVVRDGNLLAEPFLDITDRVSYGNERGLLGLAFDPDFRATARFFVYYTDLDGNSKLEAYLEIDRTDRADASAPMTFLEIEQPFPNHNGGQIEFGPDGMLYLGLGDGGGAGDPDGHGQDPTSLLGSILRLHVRDQVGPPYRIPADNPFVGDLSRRPEIWHYGLRNPWRFSFDSDGVRLIIADVGQDRWEEINAVAVEDAGVNFGWNVMEGSECFGGVACDGEGLRFPIAEYGRSDGCSVTGGYVYSGQAIPALRGRYVYSDYCAGWLRTFRISGNGTATDPVELAADPEGRVTSLGRDAQDELYVITDDGRVQKLVSGS